MKKSKRKRLPARVTERDQKILRFLWKWKVVSTSAISIKFFPKTNPHTCYCRLLALEKLKLIKCNDLGTSMQVGWSLEEKGFRYINSKLGDLESKGFRSEFLEHDFFVTAFHLGEWLVHQPESTQTYSEQQLRRIHPELWPAWVPKSSTHRPDGYSLDYRGDSPHIYAFEVELNMKAKHRYESAVAFYDSEQSVNVVLWLIGKPGMLKAIESAFEKFRIRELNKHNFILLEDFQKNGWMSRIIQGRLKGKRVAELLVEKGHTNPLHLPYSFQTLALLNCDKRPIKSNICGNPGFSKFSD